MYTLTQSINWAQTYIEYSPLNAGTSFEPALSIASMIRSTILNAPLTWAFNRGEYRINTPNTPASLTAGIQDYVFNITDFAYLEKISLLDAAGQYGYELTDIYNTNILGIPADNNPSAQAQPNAAAVKYYSPGTNVAIRFLSVPDQAYTGTITYQKLALPFQTFTFQSVNEISGVAYYNLSGSYPSAASNAYAGQQITVTGFDIAANNGTFTVVFSNASYFILANPNAVNDSVSIGTGMNLNWYPIPDSFMDIFNNLFLAEAMEVVDDARGQQYRQRGVAALLSKADGLTDMQVNAFLAQYTGRLDTQLLRAQLRTTQGNQARGI